MTSDDNKAAMDRLYRKAYERTVKQGILDEKRFMLSTASKPNDAATASTGLVRLAKPCAIHAITHWKNDPEKPGTPVDHEAKKTTVKDGNHV